jgi:hypothetical protein
LSETVFASDVSHRIIESGGKPKTTTGYYFQYESHDIRRDNEEITVESVAAVVKAWDI